MISPKLPKIRVEIRSLGEFNRYPLWMKYGKSTKRYPHEMIQETLTGGDGYPVYMQRKPDNDASTTTLNIRNVVSHQKRLALFTAAFLKFQCPHQC